MALYRIENGKLSTVPQLLPGPDLLEKQIEGYVWDDLETFLGEPLFRVRRQAQLKTKGIPDILALDEAGRVVVIEVKRSVERPQLSQALEYAGWAMTTNLQEVAQLYQVPPDRKGHEAFFADWIDFTSTETPIPIAYPPRLCLIAEDFHDRTADALSFLKASGTQVVTIPIKVYREDAQVFLQVENDAISSPGVPPLSEDGSTVAKKVTRTTVLYKGRRVRLVDLLEARLVAVGDELTMAMSGTSGTAVIGQGGVLLVGHDEFNSPSAAGQGIVGSSVDGWRTWRHARSGQLLNDLRSQLIADSQLDESSEPPPSMLEPNGGPAL